MFIYRIYKSSFTHIFESVLVFVFERGKKIVWFKYYKKANYAILSLQKWAIELGISTTQTEWYTLYPYFTKYAGNIL